MYVNDRTIDGYGIDELYEMWIDMSDLSDKRKEEIAKLKEEIENLKQSNELKDKQITKLIEEKENSKELICNLIEKMEKIRSFLKEQSKKFMDFEKEMR